jgi:hypothetical protein
MKSLQDLQSDLYNQLTNQQAITYNSQDIIAQANDPESAFQELVTFSFDSPYSFGMQQLAGFCSSIAPNSTIASILGNGLEVMGELVNANILFGCSSISFGVVPSAKKITCIDTTLNVLHMDGNLGALPGAGFSVKTLELKIGLNNQSVKSLNIGLGGEVKVGGSVFVFFIDFQSLLLQIQLKNTPGTSATYVTDLFNSFKIDSPLFQELEIADFYFAVDVLAKSVYTEIGLAIANNGSIPLVGNLSLQDISVMLRYSPKQPAATLGCTFAINNLVALNTLLSYVSDASITTWQFAAGLDLYQTQANYNKLGEFNSQYFTSDGNLLVSSLLDAFDSGLDLPSYTSGGDTAFIETLSAQGTLVDGKPNNTTYQFQTTFGLIWHIGDNDFTATTAIAINGGTGITTNGSLAFTLVVDGVEIDFEYDFGKTTTLNASIDAGDFKLSGSYNESLQQIIISFTDNITLSIGGILARIARLFTGNPNIGLSAPWDELDNIGSFNVNELTFVIDMSKRGQTTYTLKIDTKGTLKLFDIVSIDWVSINYSAADGLTFKVGADFSAIGGPTEPSWNPADPSSAPSLPGKGANVLDIQLVAAGQNVSLPATPTTMQDAITAISAALTVGPDSNPTTYPDFGGNGWLLGIHLVVLNQVDLQLVFDDPDFYGAAIMVNKSSGSKPTYLDALAGLNAQILYRKINNTVGVYDASLTLPSSIKNIDYGFCTVELPSLAVQVYTDGGFFINVGFPYNDNFSQSVNIYAGEYTGAGGFYFGRLSPQDAPPVPTVANNAGNFGTLTEMGIGLQFGIYESFSSGPFSAELSALIQGLLQGAYAPFYLYAKPADAYEYYKIEAMVSVSGKLQGTVNFVIIKANVLVAISITADAIAEAYKQTAIAVVAKLDVDLSVTIDCGLFTISKHFSFNYNLNYQALLGSNSQAPWEIGGAQPAIEKQQLDLRGHIKPIPETSIPLNVYLLPILTVDGATGQPAYVLQFGIPSVSGNAPQNFFDFGMLVLAWFVQAYNLKHQVKPSGNINDINTSITALLELQEYLQRVADKKENVFGIDGLAELFRHNLQLTLVGPGNDSISGEIAFFPALPNLSISMDDALINPEFPEARSITEGYVLLTAQTMLGYGIQTAYTFDDALFTLGNLATALTSGKNPASSAIEAVVSRYMLHGTQVHKDGQWIGLYKATGQQHSLPKNAQELPSYQLYVTSPDWERYGIAKPSKSLTMTAGVELYTAFQISTFATSPSVDNLDTKLMQFITRVERPFKFAVSTVLASSDNTLSGALAPLSRDFNSYLSDHAGSLLQSQLTLTDVKTKTAIPTYELITVISFKVKQISMGLDANQNEIPAYSVISLDTSSFENLQALILDLQSATNAPTITSFGLACTTKDKTVISDVANNQLNFFYQANFSTDSAPGTENILGQVSGPDPYPFLDKLLIAAITNSGGIYLRASALAPASEVVDNHGVGTLSLVISFTKPNGALPSYLTALRIQEPQLAAGDALKIEIDKLTVPRPTTASGIIGFELAYTALAGDTTNYQSTINSLFHLCSFEPTLVHEHKTYQLASEPLVSSPTTPVNRVCTQTLDLLSAMAGHQGLARFLSPNIPFTEELMDDIELLLSGDLAHTGYDPYQYVGDQFNLNPKWMDLFGNAIPMEFGNDAFTIPWTDPIVGINAWPGLSLSYEVKKIRHDLIFEEPALQLHFEWRPPGANITGDLKAANRYRLQYAKIYHQLNQAYTTAFVSSTMLSLDVHDCVGNTTLIAKLRDVAWKILVALDTHFYDPGHIISFDPVSVSFKDTPFNTDVLFPLTFRMTIQLNDQYVDLLADGLTPADVNTSCVLQPKGSGGNSFALDTFAKNLENAMSSMDYKVMKGSREGADDLWLLRYGSTGLQISITEVMGDQLNGFAPPPLMTELYSNNGLDTSQYNTNLAGFDTTNTFKLPGTLNIAQLDTDKTLAAFLNQLEQLLTAKNALVIKACDSTAIQNALVSIQQTKYLLAYSLAANTLDLTNGGTAPLAAQNSYTQAILKRATSFYDVDAVALLQTALTLNGATDTLGLFNAVGVYGGFVSPLQNEVHFSAVEGIIDATQSQL